MKIAATGEDDDIPFETREVVGYPTTDLGWPIVPDALREWLVMFRARFRAALPPIIITEGGCAYNMGPGADGVVDDQPRIDYLRAHINAVSEAITRGVDVRGYYCWSLMDNFEWAEGLSQRFGLVHVDHDTLRRTPKSSFHWYADLIAAQPQHL
jgi:beta-glucosidase